MRLFSVTRWEVKLLKATMALLHKVLPIHKDTTATGKISAFNIMLESHDITGKS